jgi:hypothetical protein
VGAAQGLRLRSTIAEHVCLCPGVFANAGLPNELRNESFLTEGLIAEFPQVVYFSIINTDKQESFRRQQIVRKIESWIHHIQPLRVEAAIGFHVGAKLFSL